MLKPFTLHLWRIFQDVIRWEPNVIQPCLIDLSMSGPTTIHIYTSSGTGAQNGTVKDNLLETYWDIRKFSLPHTSHIAKPLKPHHVVISDIESLRMFSIKVSAIKTHLEYLEKAYTYVLHCYKRRKIAQETEKGCSGEFLETRNPFISKIHQNGSTNSASDFPASPCHYYVRSPSALAMASNHRWNSYSSSSAIW